MGDYLGSLLRNKLFWLLDSLKGSPIKKHFNDIKFHDESKLINEEALINILSYATNNINFYENIFSTDLKDFPVLNKSIIIDNQDTILSKEEKYKPFHLMQTSGSTGTPFKIYQDKRKRQRVIADLLYYNELGGQIVGSKYLHIKTFYPMKGKISSFKQNEITYNLKQIKKEKIKEIIEIIKNKNINSILAYASTYEAIDSYLDYNQVNNQNLKSIFTSSSVLNKEIKKSLSQKLKCEVLDRYSNQENGVIAQSKTTEGHFEVNTGSFIVELLKLNSDDNCHPGEVGRIVITDLFNYSTPMIRYDTGDLGISDDRYMDRVLNIKTIEGRKLDVLYDTQGSPLTPHIMSVNMREYDKLKQWQLIQNSEYEYLIRLNGAYEVYEDSLIELKLKKYLALTLS